MYQQIIFWYERPEVLSIKTENLRGKIHKKTWTKVTSRTIVDAERIGPHFADVEDASIIHYT